MEVFAGFVGIFADNTLYVSNICFHCCNIRLFSRMGKDWEKSVVKRTIQHFYIFYARNADDGTAFVNFYMDTPYLQ